MAIDRRTDDFMNHAEVCAGRQAGRLARLVVMGWNWVGNGHAFDYGRGGDWLSMPSILPQ